MNLSAIILVASSIFATAFAAENVQFPNFDKFVPEFVKVVSKPVKAIPKAASSDCRVRKLPTSRSYSRTNEGLKAAVLSIAEENVAEEKSVFVQSPKPKVKKPKAYRNSGTSQHRLGQAAKDTWFFESDEE